MGLQMGLGSSNTLPLGRQRGSVSFQMGRSDIWVTCLIMKGRGTARAAETPCLGTWSPAVSAGWEKKGLCLWATFQARCPTDTSPHPAPLLMVLQKSVPCLPLPHLKRSSASWEVLIRSCVPSPCGLGSCSGAAVRSMNHPVYTWLCCVCIVLTVINPWKSGLHSVI